MFPLAVAAVDEPVPDVVPVWLPDVAVPVTVPEPVVLSNDDPVAVAFSNPAVMVISSQLTSVPLRISLVVVLDEAGVVT